MSTAQDKAADQINWFENIIRRSDQLESNGDKLDWLQQARADGAEEVRKLGVPNRKLETWRYTSVDPLLKLALNPADAEFTALQEVDIKSIPLLGEDSFRLVFANGRLVPHLSQIEDLPPEIKLGSLRASLLLDDCIASQLAKTRAYKQIPGHVFTALNTATINDGLFLHVPANSKLQKPLEVIYITLGLENAVISQPRNLVVLDEGAEATILEQYVSTGKSVYANNVLTEISLADNTKLIHTRYQDESDQAFHLNSLYLNQAAGSQYDNTGFAIGSQWSRTDINVSFEGEGAHCDLSGLYTVGAGQLNDVHLNIEHRVPGCTSEEHFKGILYGKGRAVFDGRILVEKDAQQTNANLSNGNLLLTRDAEIDTKPQLEIYADDVKCSHGTTVGQLEPIQLFYLRSRGISEADARKMLSLGFAGEVMEHCRVTELKSRVETRVQQQLESAEL